MSSSPSQLEDSILKAWFTNNRTMTFLVERLPSAVWKSEIPGTPRKTIQMLAAHVHNARCAWIKTLGAPHGVAVPEKVDRRTVKRSELVRALDRSSRGIAGLLTLAIEHDGQIPPTPAYVWRNLPLDVGHVLSYFVAHEAHHRGQILLVARQLGLRLPNDVVGGLWAWNKRTLESHTRR